MNRFIIRWSTWIGLAAVTLIVMQPVARAQGNQAQLIAAAKQEGRVMLYGGLIPPVARTVKKMFEKKYPGIRMDWVFLSGAPMLSRLMSEEGAGRHIADTLFMELPRLYPLRAKNYLAQYVSTESSNFDKKWQSNPAGYWIEPIAFTTGIMYNKGTLPAGTKLDSFQSLLDPSLKGHLAITSPVTNDMILAMFAGLIRDLGPEKSKQYLNALVAQQPLILGPAGSRVGQGVFTGEFPVGIGYLTQVYSIGKGDAGPMRYVANGKSIYAVAGLSTAVMAHAPHPNAARLLVDFINSKEVQSLLINIGYVPHRKGAKLLPAMEHAQIADAPRLSAAEADALRSRFTKLFSLSADGK